MDRSVNYKSPDTKAGKGARVARAVSLERPPPPGGGGGLWQNGGVWQNGGGGTEIRSIDWSLYLHRRWRIWVGVTLVQHLIERELVGSVTRYHDIDWTVLVLPTFGIEECRTTPALSSEGGEGGGKQIIA